MGAVFWARVRAWPGGSAESSAGSSRTGPERDPGRIRFMRAVQVDRLLSPEELVVREIESPPLAEDEVRIQVAAAGCNFSDLLMLKGEYQVRPDLPFVPGGEVAGTVIEVGREVRDLAVGDRVLSRCALGGFAEEVAAPAATTHRMPDALSRSEEHTS